MLARLKQASRHSTALVWAMVIVFALAPVISVAYGAPAGVLSRFVLHAHADADHGHLHHGDDDHHDHGHHDHGRGGHHHDDAVTDDSPGDPGQGPAHVHYDVCCPSLMMSTPATGVLYRLGHRVAIPPAEARQGAPPGRLLRPPILLL
jgi:hypothetical protein